MVSNQWRCSNDLGATKKWSPPASGLLKCNIHAAWWNENCFIGGAWITRDHRGNVGVHARDALLPTPDKLSAELCCLVWVLRSLRDMRVEEVSIGTESQRLVEAIKNPIRWPRYSGLLTKVASICAEFTLVAFEVESSQSNKVANAIASSVLRDGRLRSYLAMGGPAWLHNIIMNEASQANS